jgi:hypothetical protein
MHYALSIRRTAGEMGQQTAIKDEKREGKRANFVRENGQILLRGNSQGWGSLNRPLAVVESFPFEMY